MTETKENLSKIRKDPELLKLAREIKQLHFSCQGQNFFNPEQYREMNSKMVEYRQKLEEKSIVDSQKAKTLDNKAIFLKYVVPSLIVPPPKKSWIKKLLGKIM